MENEEIVVDTMENKEIKEEVMENEQVMECHISYPKFVAGWRDVLIG